MTANGDKDKQAALEIALGRIEKDYGKGAVMRLGEMSQRIATEVIPTGSLTLDLALGVGGIPRGRVTEIYGTESAGKSTLAIHIMAETQKGGGLAAYIDVEHAMDPQYAGNCGLNLDDLLISQPDSAEQALDITEQLVRSGAIDTIVIDSVAALVPRAEVEGDMGDTHMGLQGPVDVPGTAEINLHHSSLSNGRGVHQPVEGEDRGCLRQSRGYAGRASAEVLQFGENRPAARRIH